MVFSYFKAYGVFSRLKSYRIVICPSCDTNFQNSNSPPAKPQYVKILRSKNTVELQFHDYEKLNNWIKRVGLTKNSDGLPTLPEAVESLLALKESNSLTFVAKEIMNEKVRSARKSPSAQVQTCSRHRKVSTSQRQSVVTDEHSRDMVAELRIDTTQSFVRIISNESGTEEKRTATGIMEKKSISNCKALDSGRAIRSTTQKPQERQQNSRDRSNHERTRNQRRSMETRHCHSPGSDHRLTRQVLNHRDSRAQIPLDRKNGWDGRDVNDNVRRGKDQRQSRNRQNLRRSPRKDYSRTTGTSEANSQLLYREQTKSLTDIKDPAKSKTKKSPEATTPDKNSGLSTRDVREKNKKISVGQEMQIENSRKEGEVSCEQEGIPVVPSSKSCSRDPSDNREKPAADCEKGKSPPTESPIIIPKKKMTYESYIKRKQLATEAKDSPATSALPDEVEKNTNENLAQAGMPFVVAPCINEWERYYEGQISPLPPTPVKVASAPVAIPQSPLVSVNPLRNSLDFGSPTPESPHLFKSPRTTPLKSLPVKKRLEMFAIDQRKAIGGLDGVNDCHSLPGNDGTMSSVLSCGRAFHIMQEWLGDMNVGASVLETSPIKKLADSFAWKLSPIKPPNRESIDQQKTPEAKKQSSGMSGNVEAESSYPIEAISFKKMLDEQVGLAEVKSAQKDA